VKKETWTAPDGREFPLGPFYLGPKVKPVHPGTYEVWLRGRDEATGRYTWDTFFATWPDDLVWTETGVYYWRGLAVRPAFDRITTLEQVTADYATRIDFLPHFHSGAEASTTDAPAELATPGAPLELDVDAFLKDHRESLPDPTTEKRLADWRYWFWTGIVLLIIACVVGAMT